MDFSLICTSPPSAATRTVWSLREDVAKGQIVLVFVGVMYANVPVSYQSKCTVQLVLSLIRTAAGCLAWGIYALDLDKTDKRNPAIRGPIRAVSFRSSS